MWRPARVARFGLAERAPSTFQALRSTRFDQIGLLIYALDLCEFAALVCVQSFDSLVVVFDEVAVTVVAWCASNMRLAWPVCSAD